MKKTILALTLALSLQGLAAASAADNDYIMSRRPAAGSGLWT